MLRYPVFILVSLPALLLGMFTFKYPRKILRIQKKFYYLINWYIEPVSFEKEMRNTRIMGASLVFFVLLGYAYIFTR